ncbi:dihydroneopterin aldolase [Paenactinomyces guangxiensis]|uniref:7,8-dihydroneopterin aldolase n=1 Tax=Paenactinomyces guangxiensis TaxID=1490290 RepID=A0A7W2AA20_9BACL|nr:dihydroneopterin aldolase [Paenactinomyces guangxiensis]MBA4495797.1 dihydroneopterin aldolase [Paenactinomyces guangxiensis]MBH8592887.1 dihydroneopterin aldolase [Paenactinomyces guangxiensis]
MDKIFFKQMYFYGYHGAYPEENRLGQRFYVDLELGLDLRPSALTDDLNKTVNYAEVYGAVRKEVEETQVQLVETLAERIADRLLQDFPIEQVLVRVTKPDPPIPGHYQAVGVEIFRSRA